MKTLFHHHHHHHHRRRRRRRLRRHRGHCHHRHHRHPPLACGPTIKLDSGILQSPLPNFIAESHTSGAPIRPCPRWYGERTVQPFNYAVCINLLLHGSYRY